MKPALKRAATRGDGKAGGINGARIIPPGVGGVSGADRDRRPECYPPACWPALSHPEQRFTMAPVAMKILLRRCRSRAYVRQQPRFHASGRDRRRVPGARPKGCRLPRWPTPPPVSCVLPQMRAKKVGRSVLCTFTVTWGSVRKFVAVSWKLTQISCPATFLQGSRFSADQVTRSHLRGHGRCRGSSRQ